MFVNLSLIFLYILFGEHFGPKIS